MPKPSEPSRLKIPVEHKYLEHPVKVGSMSTSPIFYEDASSLPNPEEHCLPPNEEPVQNKVDEQDFPIEPKVQNNPIPSSGSEV